MGVLQESNSHNAVNVSNGQYLDLGTVTGWVPVKGGTVIAGKIGRRVGINVRGGLHVSGGKVTVTRVLRLGMIVVEGGDVTAFSVATVYGLEVRGGTATVVKVVKGGNVYIHRGTLRVISGDADTRVDVYGGTAFIGPDYQGGVYVGGTRVDLVGKATITIRGSRTIQVHRLDSNVLVVSEVEPEPAEAAASSAGGSK
jgi:hypothetical protein